MEKSQLDKIKRSTGYDYIEIVEMSDKDFFFNITKLLAKGILTPQQHEWLDKQRQTKDLDSITTEALKIFGGRLIK